MNNLLINSKVLIAELYNDYNIKSDDFVSRFPTWVVSCIRELKIIQNLIELECKGEFDSYKYLLPFNFETIIDVIVNKDRASLRDESKFDAGNLKSKIKTILVRTPDQIKPPLTLYNTDNLDREKEDVQKVQYFISNNWLHLNIDHGDIVVRYKGFPIIFDSQDNINYPLIYNNELLKKAIKLYVMKMLLLRGYIHPILNLKENNLYTNPALEYDFIRHRVRTSCNKFSNDERSNIAELLSTMF